MIDARVGHTADNVQQPGHARIGRGSVDLLVRPDRDGRRLGGVADQRRSPLDVEHVLLRIDQVWILLDVIVLLHPHIVLATRFGRFDVQPSVEVGLVVHRHDQIDVTCLP